MYSLSSLIVKFVFVTGLMMRYNCECFHDCLQLLSNSFLKYKSFQPFWVPCHFASFQLRFCFASLWRLVSQDNQKIYVSERRVCLSHVTSQYEAATLDYQCLNCKHTTLFQWSSEKARGCQLQQLEQLMSNSPDVYIVLSDVAN